ncbi:homoserine O-acetyltransferase family protein [Aureibacter tunicatorum]|uniref:Homoserine O-acetyltransferase n=1 Tax=Aureibacter tunicatorum TaxID=866807 RepID=A0AAE3XJ61_9BACT|nr:homoserine O-acetyltransferase [Aureibacter tunicatorum]MDR6237708.1 homoserine O-acetyltransferase [Aureibacter tunicatorum]BDD02743.1 homoserine O-acetyltransferase [Aureibacter tunicatorum]
MLSHQVFKYDQPYEVESGDILPCFDLFYVTMGKLNPEKDNVIWVCHAFTGSGDFTDWWPGLFGKGKLFDPDKHFVICANMLGGCYGSTGPLSNNPKTGEPYYHDFPQLTNRDIVGAFEILRNHFGFEKIHTLIGCSMGGQQALEWAISKPNIFERLISIGSNAKQSPWGVAFNESQRMAIRQDQTWPERSPEAGVEGMKTARAIALISYRNYNTYNISQSEDTDEKIDNFKASSYQNYQGEKLARRFNAYTYWLLSKAMDSHNVGRDRGGVEHVLNDLTSEALFIGVSSDTLFPTLEQKHMAEHALFGSYSEIHSDYGHDGFLLEADQLTEKVNNFYKKVEQKRRFHLKAAEVQI